MHAYEFKAEIDDGKIMIPERYIKKIGKRVKVIVLTEDEKDTDTENTNTEFEAIRLNTTGFRFNREEANER